MRLSVYRYVASILVLCCPLLAPAAAGAQPDEPVGGFVVDVRGSVAPYGRNEVLAGSRGLDPLATPATGLGFEAGAHAYPLRWRVITFGVGASFHTSRGNRGPDLLGQPGPTLQTTFTAISPQVSFNFGGRDGWSYLSGGMGTSRLTLRTAGDDLAPPQRRAKHAQLRRRRALVSDRAVRVLPRPPLLRHQPAGTRRPAPPLAPHDPHGAQHRRLAALTTRHAPRYADRLLRRPHPLAGAVHHGTTTASGPSRIPTPPSARRHSDSRGAWWTTASSPAARS